MSALKSPLQKILADEVMAIDASVALLLLWVAGGNGELQPAQQQLLNDFHNQIGVGQQYQAQFLQALRADDIAAIVDAAKILQTRFGKEESAYFMELAIGVVGAANPVSQAALHCLRALADILSISDEQLKRLYLKNTSSILQEPGDLSSSLWWEFAESKSASGNENNLFKHHEGQLTEIQARAILGVAPDASLAEVKTAYRKLAQHYHPDRHQVLGGDAAKKAQNAFVLINQAYEVLSQ